MTEISQATDFISDLANRMNVWTYLPRRFASPRQQLGATSSNASRHRHPRFTGTRLLEKKQVISLQGNSQPSQRRAMTAALQGTDKEEDTLNSWVVGLSQGMWDHRLSVLAQWNPQMQNASGAGTGLPHGLIHYEHSVYGPAEIILLGGHSIL